MIPVIITLDNRTLLLIIASINMYITSKDNWATADDLKQLKNVVNQLKKQWDESNDSTND